MLTASHLITSQIHEFVLQNLEVAMEDLGYLKDLVRKVVDIAAVGDIAMNGDGRKKRKKKNKCGCHK